MSRAARSLLHECGEALYGHAWQSPIARDLGVSTRTMQRWAAGTHDVPPGAYVDCLRLLQERASVIDALIERLPEAAATRAARFPDV